MTETKNAETTLLTKVDPVIPANAVMKYLDPDQFVVNDAIRGRAEAPSIERVTTTAKSIAELGQFQPILAFELEDGKYRPVFGFTRITAVGLLREGFSDTETHQEYKDATRQVWTAVIPAMSEEDAFLRTIAENLERADTSDWDEALNQKRLRDEFGKNDVEIARAYHYNNTNRVAQLRRCIEKLPEDIWQKIHRGRLSLFAAENLLQLGDDTTVYYEALAKANPTPEDPTSKYDGAKVRDFIRDELSKANDSAAQAPTVAEQAAVAGGESVAPVAAETKPNPKSRKGKGKGNSKGSASASLSRGAGAAKKYFGEIVELSKGDNIDGWTESQVNFSKVILKWFDGTASDRQLTNAFVKVNDKS